MLRAPDFFRYARERYAILLSRRQGNARPWSNDPILQKYRFCNVFREDDTTTQWVRNTITPAGYGKRLVGAMVIARWFNRVETLERLLPPEGCNTPYFLHNLLYEWEDAGSWPDRMRERLKGVKPLVTGAYMVKTPPGLSKLDGLLGCMETVLWDAAAIQNRFQEPGMTLEGTTAILCEYPYLGPFMAYEVVTDLRHTILSEALDIMTWANPGPGAARGMSRVVRDEPAYYNRHNKHDYAAIMDGMRALLVLSSSNRYWPQSWPAWEMREVEHTLCEFDKYERARLGQGTPKQRYNGAV